ncbi:MAG: helix-turn-helix transcriptional regulator [Geminicoccaceae bacterium]
MTQRDLLGLVELCYAAVARRDGWAEFAAALGAAFASPVAAIATVVRQPDGIDWAVAHGIAPAVLGAAVEHALEDPRAPLYERLRPGQGYVYDDFNGHDIGAVKRTDYYRLVLQPMDTLWAMAARLDEGRELEGLISVHRPERASRYTGADLRDLEVLSRHVGRARRLQLDMHVAEVQAIAHAQLLDRLSIGLVILAAGGRVLQLNAAARRIVGVDDGLTVRGARVRIADPAAAARFEALMAMAARGQLDGVGGVLAVARPSGLPAYALSLVRCFAELSAVFGSDSLVLVSISDPVAVPGLDAAVLRSLWSLTAAEAQVAIALASGIDVDEVAQRQGIAVSTVRVHLRKVMAKTGTRRQSELVRLILAGPGLLPGDPAAGPPPALSP